MIARPTFILIAVGCAAALLCLKVYSAGRALVMLRDAEPRIATIDFYGLQHVTASQLTAKLGLQVGDAAPVIQLDEHDLFRRLARPLFGVDTKQSVESKLREIPGVRDAAVTSVQENDPHRRSLFVGISENDTVPPRRTFHGDAILPEPVADLFDRHSEAFLSAIANSPDLDEDDSSGYAVFTDAAMRALEEKAIAFVRSPQNWDALTTVLRTSAAAQQRRGAAWLVSYGLDPQQTAAALTDALDDPDADVRNIACRELIIIAEFGLKNPASMVRIAPDRLIQMLNSVIWTDRDKAMGVLDPLTATLDSKTLLQLRHGGLTSLEEMARWNAAAYARMAYQLIGRIAGLADADIKKTWGDGKIARERVIRTATTQ